MLDFNNFKNSDTKILIISLGALMIIIFILLILQIFRILINRHNNKKYVWNSVVANIVDANQNNPENIDKIINHKTNWDYEYTCLKKIHNLEIKSGIHIEGSDNVDSEKFHKINEVKILKNKAFKLFEKNKNNSIFTESVEQKNQIKKIEKSISHESAKEANFSNELIMLEKEIKNLKDNNFLKHPKKPKNVLKK